jgi:energy-converting hydrogenase Eha subunit B
MLIYLWVPNRIFPGFTTFFVTSRTPLDASARCALLHLRALRCVGPRAGGLLAALTVVLGPQLASQQQSQQQQQFSLHLASMSRFLSEPITIKDSAVVSGHGVVVGRSAMQGWRDTMEVRARLPSSRGRLADGRV